MLVSVQTYEKWPFAKMRVGTTVTFDPGRADAAIRTISSNRKVYGKVAYIHLDDGSLLVRKFADDVDISLASVIMTVNYRPGLFLINGKLSGRSVAPIKLMSGKRIADAIAGGFIETHTDSSIHLTDRGRALMLECETLVFSVPSDMVDEIKRMVENAIQHRQ